MRVSAKRTAARAQDLPAGGFSSWLRQVQSSLRGGTPMDVPCGECTACCAASYFIPVDPRETDVIGRIRKELLFPAPASPKGRLVLGYDEGGVCPLFQGGGCTIYDHRPQTCRRYDCRVFAAAGIAAGAREKAAVNRRVRRWKFSYPTRTDREEHSAVKAAARFIRRHPNRFPGGGAPRDPARLAILAIKACGVFFPGAGKAGQPGAAASAAQVAQAVIDAVRKFDG